MNPHPGDSQIYHLPWRANGNQWFVWSHIVCSRKGAEAMTAQERKQMIVTNFNEVVQTTRYETKYLINEQQAEQVRAFAATFATQDPHIAEGKSSYPVHTVYLDSEHLAIYRKSVRRENGRLKLRLRFYDDHSDSPVFLEIKRSEATRRVKRRLEINRSVAAHLFQGEFQEVAECIGDEEMREAIVLHQARPIIHVAYQREAYLVEDRSDVRLTLDRKVKVQPARESLTTEMVSPVSIWEGRVIMEIKYPTRMPEAFADLTASLRIQPAKASKYMEGVKSRLR